MNGLEFSEKVVGHFVVLITAFAWPAVVVFLFYTQRTSIAKLIAAVNLKSVKGPGGVEVQFAEQLKENAATIAEAKAEVRAPVLHNVGVSEAVEAVDTTDAKVHEPPATDPNVLASVARHLNPENSNAEIASRVAEFLKAKPSVVIEKNWSAIRDALFRLLSAKGVVAGGDGVSGGWSDEYLMALTADWKFLDANLRRAIVQLQTIHNDAVLRGVEPSSTDAVDYFRNSVQVLELMEPYIRNARPVRFPVPTNPERQEH